MNPDPHLHVPHHGFWPMAVTSAGTGAWLLDWWWPFLAHVDWESGTARGPYILDEGAWGPDEPAVLSMADGEVVVRRPSGIWRFDPETAERFHDPGPLLVDRPRATSLLHERREIHTAAGSTWVSPRQPEKVPLHMGDTYEFHRIDDGTGAVVERVALPGLVIDVAPAPDGGLWTCVQQPATADHFLYGLLPGEQPRRYDLGGIDLRPHVPPERTQLDAEATERQILAQVKAELGGWADREEAGVRVERVRLDRKFPDTVVTVLLSAVQHPGLLFGRRERVWERDGALSADTDLMAFHLWEDIANEVHGLPTNTRPGPDGVVWI